MLSCEAVTRETTKDTARGTIKRIEKRENCIWRQRFLARYDYPFLENTLEFPFAYKVRQFILQGFDAAALGFGLKGKSGHQLDVVKDMILGSSTIAIWSPIRKHANICRNIQQS